MGAIALSPTNIVNNQLTYDKENTYISMSKYEESPEIMIKRGDVIFVKTGSTVGKVAYVDKMICKTTLNPQVVVLKDIKCDNYILSVIMSTRKFQNKIQRITVGGAVPTLSQMAMGNIFISLPAAKEQEKISKFISLLDERIATQNKIIDKLQTLIKGMEDNLLDNPLWEKTYLRSFMQFFPTNSLSWEQLSYKEGAIRNLHYGLIHGLQTRGINSVSLPMIKNEAIPKQYTLCQVGDVAFADASEDTGEIAKSVEFVDTIEGDTICGLHTIHGRDIKNRTVVGFKGFAFNSRYFHNQIKRLAQGTKVFSITANNLSSCYVYLPDLETQKAIVNLLKTYEAKLLVSKRLLEHYEKQKQYLLRQMFI